MSDDRTGTVPSGTQRPKVMSRLAGAAAFDGRRPLPRRELNILAAIMRGRGGPGPARETVQSAVHDEGNNVEYFRFRLSEVLAGASDALS